MGEVIGGMRRGVDWVSSLLTVGLVILLAGGVVVRVVSDAVARSQLMSAV